jgi:hypothetical protein
MFDHFEDAMEYELVSKTISLKPTKSMKKWKD